MKMISEPIILIGSGGHAKSCVDVIESGRSYCISGFVTPSGNPSDAGMNYPALGSDHDLEELLGQYRNALIAVGHIKNPEPRIRLFESVKQYNGNLPVIVSRHAYVSPGAIIGEGTIIMHGAVVNAGSLVGKNCIINSGALIEHDVRVGDHCHISTCVAVNGSVSIGSRTFIGSGSVLRESVQIGDDCIIGMTQSIRRNIPDGALIPGEI